MRKVLLLAVAVVACSKAETPAADTAAAAAPPPPAAPAALTAADVRGTWNGTGKREGSDSATTFTVTNTTDSTGKVVFSTGDSATTKTKFDGDSMIVTSGPYKDPNAPKNAPLVTFRSIGRLKDGKLVGVAAISPAAKPDTVVARVNWEATRAP